MYRVQDLPVTFLFILTQGFPKFESRPTI